MAGRATRSAKPSSQHKEHQPRAKWTSALNKLLVEVIIDQVQKVSGQQHCFGKVPWKQICEEFYNKTGHVWDKEQLKYRYSLLRRQYVTVKSMLEQNDFSWDESTGQISATKETWDNYIKGHPDAEPLRFTGCPVYKQLCTMFSEPDCNGSLALSAEQVNGTPFLTAKPLPLSIHQDVVSSGSEEFDDVAYDEDFHPCTSGPPGSRKRGRKGIDDHIGQAILEMATASKLKTAAIRQRNARYTITDCIEELDRMQGVNDQVYYAALDLFNNPIYRETFLALKGDKRLTWLTNKCTGRSVLSSS